MRGRRPQLDAIKQIKGNPGRRPLAAGATTRRSLPSAAELMPDFLTTKDEKKLFTRLVDEYLQRRLARPSDAIAYGRYCVWVIRWQIAKTSLDGKVTWYESSSLHGKLARRHPLFKDMIDLERVLQSEEDRLGLNPLSRQNIVRGLAAAPAALGGLFDAPDEKPESEPASPGPPAAPPEERPPSPIGLGRVLN